MKVLVVKTFDYTLESWSKNGTLDRELSLYKMLNAKYNTKFTILTWTDGENLDSLSRFGIEVFPIYKNQVIPSNKILRILKSFILPFRLKKHLETIDIIKQNQLMGSWFSIILKTILRKPLYVRTGYDMHQFSIQEKKKFYKKTMYKLLTKITLLFSDLYTVSSNSDLNLYKNNKIVLRRNWILNNEYHTLSNRYSDRILSVGRLEKQKDFIHLINQVSGLSIQVDIVGEGSEMSKLKQYAKIMNVKVNFLGNLNHHKLEELYKKYKYYVSTSNYEGNPKTVLESLSFGCVVILSNIPNHNELIKHNNSGFIFNKKNNELNSLLVSIFNGLYDLDKIAKKGFESVQRNNALLKAVENEIKDYNALLNKQE